MKTFKLISLQVLELIDQKMDERQISLMDGLIINRENEAENQWIIEAYMKSTNKLYFKNFKKDMNGIMLKAMISKPSNKPALFIADIIDVNQIGDNINVLFHGSIIDLRLEEHHQLVDHLINKGYYGKELLKKFEKNKAGLT